ncbi:MAG: ABC transporter ATP-binding protein [Planctomycetota bacterium]|nr:ABC transporter ATP-binding protein [Planctomycetota bacterium]MDA1179887.1 ABC transporter ATP-binding protein [Planctomycetota bacterium]
MKTPIDSVANVPHERGNCAVQIDGVTKAFGKGEASTVALSGVDVHMFLGEMTLLVGPSGCGKTTLISIIAGLLNPTSGSVTILGTRLDRLSGSKQVRFRAQNIGFVFQQYNLLPTLSAVENVAVPLLIAGMSRRLAVQHAAKMLGAVELEHRADARPNQLSGGQQQRVAIARSLIHEPRILVCDEPTAALDTQSGQNVMQLLARVAVDQNRAVIIVTHDNRILQFGQRIIHMSDGTVEFVDDKSKGEGHDRQ